MNAVAAALVVCHSSLVGYAAVMATGGGHAAQVAQVGARQDSHDRALVIVLLSNGGYWFGGEEGTITVAWAARGELPSADLFWELRFGDARLGSGRLALEQPKAGAGRNEGDDDEGDADAPNAAVRITTPEVRVRTRMRWVYTIRQREGGDEAAVLETGEVAVHVFPPDGLAGVAERVGKDKKKIVVWDGGAGDDGKNIAAVLKSAGVPHEAVTDGSALAAGKVDVLLVGAGAAGESPFEQGPLLARARAGAGVLVFRQAGPLRLAGYELVARKSPQRLGWRQDHPLLAGLEPADLEAWVPAGETLTAVRLPADEPALELAWWPAEQEAAADDDDDRRRTPAAPVPIDALIVTKSVGAGRIVLCQLPAGDFERDPRARVLLANAIDYLLTRPEPTPRPSQRPKAGGADGAGAQPKSEPKGGSGIKF